MHAVMMVVLPNKLTCGVMCRELWISTQKLRPLVCVIAMQPTCKHLVQVGKAWQCQASQQPQHMADTTGLDLLYNEATRLQIATDTAHPSTTHAAKQSC